VMTAFPALGWQHAEHAGGAMVVKPGKSFASAGLAPGAIIVAAAGQPITDAPSLEKAWAKGSDDLELSVVTSGKPSTVRVER
jgi:S1-C subfamily serine protease